MNQLDVASADEARAGNGKLGLSQIDLFSAAQGLDGTANRG
ncbi:hypothetical protein [Paraburkholderia sp. BL10I2N1]|nr:hypothetical protein [Paraburkholderia sp. BL10I2N1]